jgi:hypothetical protein
MNFTTLTPAQMWATLAARLDHESIFRIGVFLNVAMVVRLQRHLCCRWWLFIRWCSRE